MIIDTHAHLDFPEFAGDLEAVIRRAADAGVNRIVTVGTSVESSIRAVALAEQYPALYAVIGIHPNAAMEAQPDAIEVLRKLAKSPRVVAIGETGLDYYRLPSSQLTRTNVEALANEDLADIEGAIRDGAVKSAQVVLFQQQLELAAELGLNVVIHQRGECWEDTLSILGPFEGKLRAVFHCFGGTPEEARALIGLGHLVSFTGIVTFNNAEAVRTTAASVPAGAFMVETDCPFLSPTPLRGKRCEPAYARLTAEKIAEVRGEPLEAVAQSTTATATEFFRLA
jgi:TatD DNase family protein